MSTFIRRYGRYLNEKAFAYRQMAFDFTRVKKGYGKHGVHAVAHSNTCLAISIFFYMLLLSVWLKPVALLLCKILSLLCYLSADGVMRTMTTEKLLKGMPVLQTQIDTLLEFDVRLCFDLQTFSSFSSSLFIWLNKTSGSPTYLCPVSSQVHPKELNNGIINAAFLLLFKDLVKLFASYNDGIINLLG